ncbi:MAG TPA: ABC transporter substrate-binding protein [Acidimicrobiales bacterium]|nr:ABC transporter substrate-binding protein [Acidimicrobiales bacterium]
MIAIAILAALTAASCGDSTDTAADNPPPTTPTATPTSAPASTGVAGCGATAFTDQKDRTDTRTIARCDAGAPAAKPLPTKTTIKLAAQTKGEYLAPVYLAQAFGEFEKENLEVELVAISFSDAIPQLAAGRLDAVNGGPFAAFINGVVGGLDLKWVVANYSPPKGGQVSVPQSGLWVRRDAFTNPQSPDLSELKAKKLKVANTQGAGTVAIYWLERAMTKAGISYGDVDFQVVPPADQVTALKNNAISGAFLLDPYWRQAATDTAAYAQVAVQPKEPNGGIFFGPNLLLKDPAVGEAFVRAYVRTINTYLAGDYKKDPKIIDALAKAIGVTTDSLSTGDPLTFEWEIREGLLDEVQPLYIKYAAVTSTKTPLPESKLVDRTFYAKVVGATPK